MKKEPINLIFHSLDNPLRLKILEICKGKTTQKNLCTMTGSSFQTIHKHLKILKDSGLVYQSNSFCLLSGVGRLSLEFIKPIRLVSKNSSYFSNHNFGDLDFTQISTIGWLNKTTISKGYSKNCSKASNLVNKSKEKVFVILSHNCSPILEEIIEKFNQKVPCYVIFDRNFKFEYLSHAVRNKIEKFNDKKLIQNAPINLVMSEKGACLAFPNNLKSDFNFMFYGKDSKFLDWCENYFWKKWDNSDTFARFRN